MKKIIHLRKILSQNSWCGDWTESQFGSHPDDDQSSTLCLEYVTCKKCMMKFKKWKNSFD